MPCLFPCDAHATGWGRRWAKEGMRQCPRSWHQLDPGIGHKRCSKGNIITNFKAILILWILLIFSSKFGYCVGFESILRSWAHFRIVMFIDFLFLENKTKTNKIIPQRDVKSPSNLLDILLDFTLNKNTVRMNPCTAPT